MKQEKDQSGESSLERIRRAVDQLANEVGFEKMTIRAICQQADVSNGVFYHHFKSKDSLLFDRFLRTQQYMERFYEEQLMDKHAVDALKLLARASVQYMQSRVPEMLTSYLKALTTEYVEWVQLYQQMAGNWGPIGIAHKLFQKGLQNGDIASQWNARQLEDIYFSMFIGINFTFIMTRGMILSDDTLMQNLESWIESLRA